MKHSPLPFLLTLCSLAFGGATWASPVINEIYFHPPQPGTQLSPTGPENLTLEWLEIYNPDAVAVNLTGWTIGGGSVSFAFAAGQMIPAGGYSVVAANAAAFHAAHASVTNYVGNWTGELGNIDDSVDLFDAAATRVDHVHYDTEGDWAKRRKITTLDALGYPYGWLWISDADGGGKSLELVSPAMKHNNGQNWKASTAVGGSPGATNSVATADAAPLIKNVEHSPVVPTHLNLVTVRAQVLDEAGTAGVTASVKYRIPVAGTTQPAFASMAMHDDGVTGDDISADGIYAATLPAQAVGKLVEYYVEAKDAANHIQQWPAASDETGGHNANALYQVDEESYSGVAPFYRILMTPNELAGLDAEPHDSANRTDQRYLCSFIAFADGTFTERQLASTRIRGAGSRGSATRSVRVDFSNSEPWQGNVAVNLNAQYTYLQFLGAQLSHAAGIIAADATPVQVRFNGVNRLARNSVTGLTTGQDESHWVRNYGMMAHVEPINRDFLKHHLAGDSSGDLYAKRGGGGTEWSVAASAALAARDYAGVGTSGTGFGWEKQNNTSAMDYADLHSFITTMTNNAAAPGASYLANVGVVTDVNQWLQTLAVSTVLTNGETNLTNGRDDDYSMYRGIADPRFKLIFHDLDTVLGQGDASSITLADIQNSAGAAATIYDVVDAGKGGDIFNKLIPLFAQPSALSTYRQTLQELINGPFSKTNFDALVARSLANSGWTAGDIATIKTTVTQFMDGDGGSNPLGRRQQIQNKLTPALAVTSGPAVLSGYPHVTTSAISTLTGTFDATNATQLLINGQPATVDLKAGTWTNGGTILGTQTALNPGINRVILEEKNAAGEHLRYTKYDIWYEVAETNKSGTLAASTTWTAAGGPYRITADLNIGAGVTLTIQPGATIYMGPAFSINVTSTGRLLAEGTQYNHIRFTRKPGTTDAYGTIYLNAATNESRIVYADLEYGGGKAVGSHTSTMHDNGGSKIYVDHCTFTNSDSEYFSSDASSFIISNSYFQTYAKPAGYPPANGNAGSFGRPEMLHGVAGLPTGGYGIYRGNLFGHTYGFNDIIDFTGGNRPGAITQYIDNIFTSATDDCLDLDSTDAFIAGNVFLHTHQDPARSDTADTGSCVSGGTDNSDVSEWTIVGNLMYDTDHAVLAKGVNGGSNTKADRFSFLNNTVYHVTKDSTYGSVGVDIAAFNFSDDGAQLPPASGGSGAVIENNIIWDASAVVANYDGTKLSVTLNNNLLPLPWTGPGTGNSVADPLLHYDLFSALSFDKVEFESDYELIRKNALAAFALYPGSPAKGTGPGGLDRGGLVPYGVMLSGGPPPTTAATTATFTVGPAGTLNPPGAIIPAFVYGYTAYKYKLDAGAYGAETAVATPISLSGLAAGSHTIQVIGKNDAGDYQVNPTVYTWTVDPLYVAPVVINEVLATNVAAFANGTAHPDCIELRNPRATPADLSGWAISDDAAAPAKFIFPAGTSIPAGGFLVLFAGAPDGSAGIHLGFSLDGDGESVVLSRPNGAVWVTADSVTFGLQIPDYSIGRIGLDGHWDLNVPTLNAANMLQANDSPGRVLFNEWLANSEISFKDDQVELYNTSVLPGNIGGFYLSDTPDIPWLYQMPPLSFVAGKGFASLMANGKTSAQANHLPFKLDAFYDWLVMTDPVGNEVDRVAITNAGSDVSEGRLPDGATTISYLPIPTFGLTNVSSIGGSVVNTTTSVLPFSAAAWHFIDDSAGGAFTVPANWNTSAYTETSVWKVGQSPIGRSGTTAITTSLNTKSTTTPAFVFTQGTTAAPGRIAYYFRRNFNFTGDPSTVTAMTLGHYIDDGAVFYLNGQEIYRTTTMPSGAVTASTLVPSANSVSDAAKTTTPVTLSAAAIAALVNGTNLLTVEVHQVASSSTSVITTSSDIVFDCELQVTTSVGVPPTVDPERQRMIDLMTYLRISELHYAPANGSNFEFVEVTNTSTATSLNLLGVRFTAGIDYTFGSLTLAPGAFAVVAKTPGAFNGIPNVVGPFLGKLDNAGEEIALTLPLPYTANIMLFTYAAEWYPAAFGGGSSLEIIDPLAERDTWNDKSSWKPSVNSGGSPGGQTAVFNFASWQTALGVFGANNDNDGDGAENLMEYAWALDPKTPDVEKALVSAGFDAPVQHMQATFSLPVVCPTDVIYKVQTSTELGTWATISTKPGNGTWSGTAAVNASSPSNGRVTYIVADSNTLSTRARSFMRVRTELVP